MTPRGAAVVLACGVLAGTVLAEDAVQVAREGAAVRHLATIDGRVLDVALPSVPGATPAGVVLLVRPADPDVPRAGDTASVTTGPPPPPRRPPCPESDGDEPAARPDLRLVRFDPRGEGTLETIRDDVPGDARSVDRIDADGDGRDELVVGLSGAILLYGADADVRRDAPLRIDDERFEPDTTGTDGDRAGIPEGLLGSVDLGRLTLFGPVDEAPGFGRRLEVDLPVTGRGGTSGQWVETRVPVFVGSRGDGARVFATAPERFSGRRLRTQRIEIAPDGASRVTECWAALPEPEDLLESGFLWFDGEPVLWVTTKPAGKLALFGEKRLRLFRLEADRGRTGYAPLFAVETRANLWQTIWPRMHDADDDGEADLVLGYWKGLKDDKVVLDVYRRRPGLTFEPTPRTTAFDVAAGDRGWLRYGDDLDGDGTADLALFDAIGRVLLYPGRPSKRGARLIDRGGATTIFVGEGPEANREQSVVIGSDGVRTYDSDGSRPRRLIFDLDGDGRVELVLVREGAASGGARVAVVRF